jgi:hypothetical protein
VLGKGRFTTFDPPGPVDSNDNADNAVNAVRINNRGQIVGTARNGTSGDRGFLRDARGRITTIRVPGAKATTAEKLNDRGQVTGTYNNPNSPPGPQRSGIPPMGRMA